MGPYRGVMLALVRGVYAKFVLRGVNAADVLAVRQSPTCAVRENILVREYSSKRTYSHCTNPTIHVCCCVTENTF